MIQMLSDKDARVLEKKLNDLGPSLRIISIYSINQLHIAWVDNSKPKAEKVKNHEK